MPEEPTGAPRYHIVRKLGEGGMALAFLAERRGPGGFRQRVCLKRVHPAMAADPELARQFLQEARIAATLRHTNIAQVIDFGQDQDGYYLALELVDGIDLGELLMRLGRPLDPGMVTYLGTQLAAALQHAHRTRREAPRGIVHRDVSPSNILVSREGEVKLTDFGIAKSVDDKRLTRTGIIKGKVSYMAPEYARTASADTRCDLFALGVILYECLTCSRPYDGATDIDTLERASRGERSPLHALSPDVPQPLANTVEQLIEPDPSLRTQRASDVLDALLTIPADTSASRRLAALVGMCTQGRTELSHADTLWLSPSDAGLEPPATAPARPAPARTRTSNAPATQELPVGKPPPARWLTLSALFVALGMVGAAGAWLLASPPGDPEAPSGEDVAAATQPPSPEPQASVETTDEHTADSAREPEAAAAREQPAADKASPPSEAEPRRRRRPARDRARPARRKRPPPDNTPPSTQHARAAKRATLTVVVIPYGHVTVDGVARGAAPVTLRLPPGQHHISSHGAGKRVRRTVELTPGEERRVVMK